MFDLQCSFKIRINFSSDAMSNIRNSNKSRLLEKKTLNS